MIDDETSQLPKEELDRQLENALKDTFPASDPLSIGEPTGTEADRPLNRKPAEIDKVLVDELARRVERKHEAK